MDSDSPDAPALVLLGHGAPEPRRADAVRNRGKALEAAQRVYRREGIEGLTMQKVALEAGVGVGTLYRGFTDKAGLAMALLDERERRLQELMISGPAPLGPGAEPVPRLVAFVTAYVQLVADQLDLVLMSETSAVGARFRSGAHNVWRAHCRHLIQLAGAPSGDYRAEALLAALSGEMIAHGLREQEKSRTQLADDAVGLARALVVAGPDHGRGPDGRS